MTAPFKAEGKGRISLKTDEGFNNVKALYGELLVGVKIDPEHANDVIPYRKQILKHRITCEVTLIGEKGIINILNIYSLLIEDGRMIKEYWLMKEINKSSWPVIFEKFKQEMMSKKEVNNVVCQRTVLETDKVVGVNMVFDYA